MGVQSIELLAAAEELLAFYRARGLKIATAESCTGGLVAGTLTEIPGSSDVVERGFVTYSNDAKTSMLGVSSALIAEHGAVSSPVARAMAEGALMRSRADVAVAVTGVAGPGGGTATKPVGLVYFAVADRQGAAREVERRYGNIGRAAVRQRSVAEAMSLLRSAAEARLKHDPEKWTPLFR